MKANSDLGLVNVVLRSGLGNRCLIDEEQRNAPAVRCGRGPQLNVDASIVSRFAELPTSRLGATGGKDL
jgi:hypothetical protein